MLPAFSFDGEAETTVVASAHELTVAYRGWLCRYTATGEIFDLGEIARNRNGHYRTFAAAAENELQIQIEIVKQ